MKMYKNMIKNKKEQFNTYKHRKLTDFFLLYNIDYYFLQTIKYKISSLI